MSRKTTPAADPSVRDLYQAISALTTVLSLDVVLQKVADLSRELVEASYSALGVLGEDGSLVSFITSGMSQQERDRIGHIPVGKGVLGVVLRERKPLRLTNISQHPESVGFPQHHPSMNSFLGVPIIFNEQVLGDLYLTNKIGAPEFSLDDQTLVTLFASQAGIAMENARLFDIERRRSAQLDVLNRIGRDLTSILDLDKLLQTTAELVQESFGYQNVQVYWVDAASNGLQLRALAGVAPNQVSLGINRTVDQGLVGWVASNRQSAVSNDVSQDLRHLAISGIETGAELAVPFLVQGEVVGVIKLEAKEPGAFDDSDLMTLETLADQLSVAIENIQLYQQHQEQSQRLAVAEERDRIGRDLHDGVIQSIYAVGLDLEDVAERAGAEPEKVGPRLESTVQDLNQVIRDIRSYIMELRPRELQGRNPDEALGSLVRYLQDKTGASVSLDLGTDLASLPDRYVVNLWHIFQEAFSNIEKYAKAGRVSVSLVVVGGDLHLRITDDGVGFDLEKAEMGRGFGLSNIKDRAERLGGLLITDSTPGNGSTIRVTIPLAETGAEVQASKGRKGGN